MPEQKTKPTTQSVEDYINTLPTEAKRQDGFTLLKIINEITEMEPRMWGPSIIGYGQYEYTTEGGSVGETALLSFSPRKQRMVLYVLTNFEGQDELLDKLGKYKTGKVCLYINKLKDIDIDVLREIIQNYWRQSLEKNLTT